MNNGEILVIDDEPQILKLLQISLEANEYKVIQAQNALEGMHLAANHSPDLIILDLGLPDKSGHELLIDLRQWYEKAVIILSVQNSEKDIIKALDNGATDYLVKPFRTGELLARIRASMRQNISGDLQPEILVNNLKIDLANRSVFHRGEIVKLTSTEFTLLALFARNLGKVLTHQFILKEIWGVGAQNETQYLRVFVAQLRKKLEDNPNRPVHFITESGVGYRFT
ncbi:response regulator [Antarcticibacterium arcticum]|uniref:Response regulator n=1 Tax=Antarcticibacterium arcticum TaxID=2585771 RepID=A0A5B8YJA3_9FLAO|nr:response regulator [Antarcticibacterium arcticum]QED38020.1 response regulator [Antarcticibacterium arcticum]